MRRLLATLALSLAVPALAGECAVQADGPAPAVIEPVLSPAMANVGSLVRPCR